MKFPFLRATALSALIGVGVSSSGCGYLLHPERRGNNGGSIDGVTLVFDLLWLIPGIIPGVVFLIVDFSSGCMYVGGGGGGGVTVHVSDAGARTIDVPMLDATKNKTLELRIVTATKHVLDRQITTIGPAIKDRVVTLHVGTVATVGEKLHIEVVDPAHPGELLQQLSIL